MINSKNDASRNLKKTEREEMQSGVRKKYRQKGVGKVAVMKIFDMFHGGWEISQWINNLPAPKFWGKVIAEYTNGKYDMFIVMEANETGFTFDNSL